MADVGLVARSIVRAAAPTGQLGDIVVEGLCDEDGQNRSGLRWTRLLLASYQDAGGADAVPLEACVGLECAMAAADIFDEIQDGDASPLADRHGAALASNAAAALLVIGLELLNRADRADDAKEMSRSAQSVGAIAAAGLLRAAAGQHCDLSSGPTPPSIGAAIETAKAKSAALTRMACIIGAALAGADATRVEAIGHIGYQLGIAAQLRNDARGYMVAPGVERELDGDGSGSITLILTLCAMSERFARQALTTARAAQAPRLTAIATSPHRRTSEEIVGRQDTQQQPEATLVR